MCVDAAAMQWYDDAKAHKLKPTNTVPGITYMLAGAPVPELPKIQWRTTRAILTLMRNHQNQRSPIEILDCSPSDRRIENLTTSLTQEI